MNAITIPNIAQLEKVKALQIVVTSPESEAQARSYLNDVRAAGKTLDRDIKMLKRPLQDDLNNIDVAVRPWKAMLAERDQALERALLDYGRKVKLATEAANQKILERYEKKVDKVEAKAIMENKPMPLVLPPQMVATPQKTVEAEGAKQTIVVRKAWRTQKTLPGRTGFGQLERDEVTAADNDKYQAGIPLDYFVLDTARIGKVVRAGGSIPGIEVYEEESIAVRGV